MAPSIAKRDSPAEADRASRPSADPTRDRILDAALDLFSERSFDGATTREIAQRAGVTQPLLNYHYRSKDDLWRAAVDSLFVTLRQTMADRLEGLRGVEPLTSAQISVRELLPLDPQSVAWGTRVDERSSLGGCGRQ